jgi:hypothetical protein
MVATEAGQMSVPDYAQFIQKSLAFYGASTDVQTPSEAKYVDGNPRRRHVIMTCRRHRRRRNAGFMR